MFVFAMLGGGGKGGWGVWSFSPRLLKGAWGLTTGEAFNPPRFFSNFGVLSGPPLFSPEKGDRTGQKILLGGGRGPRQNATQGKTKKTGGVPG